MNKKVAIVGAQGYTGIELAKCLQHHPYATLAGVFTTNPSWHLSDEPGITAAESILHYHTDTLTTHANDFDVIFLATPPDVSLALAPTLIQHGVTTIDLSGAFRLDASTFADAYGTTHTAPELLQHARYGLAPFWQQNTLSTAPYLLANPGCYATCALMTLLPLLKAKVIDPDHIIIDAKSGVSGAGRTPKKPLLFCEMHHNFYPYKITGHQHIPEIQHCLHQFIDVQCTPTMITHLLPIPRGISMSIYAKPASPSACLDALSQAYHESYADYPLVQYAPLTGEAHDQKILELKHVVGTPKTHIGFYVKDNKILLFASIDNLLKGAASQAIENLNAIMKQPLETGLSFNE